MKSKSTKQIASNSNNQIEGERSTSFEHVIKSLSPSNFHEILNKIFNFILKAFDHDLLTKSLWWI